MNGKLLFFWAGGQHIATTRAGHMQQTLVMKGGMMRACEWLTARQGSEGGCK